MGILDIFRRPPKNTKYAKTLNGFIPVYNQFGATIYNSDAVQQALSCIVSEMKKLKPQHIRMSGDDPVPIRDSIQDVLENPNPIMTTADFLEKTTWMLLLNYNAFIVPVYESWYDDNGTEHRKYEALYPIFNTTIPYDAVIHIRYNYSVNQFMGGNEMGEPDRAALLETLKLNKQLLSGISKAMNSSYAVNGIVKYNTLLDSGRIDAALAELEQKLANNESGFLPIDLKAEFIPIERKTALVDADTLKFIDEKILRNWGVPLAILTGDFTKEQYEAFFQKSLEPLVVAFSQAFTKTLFTQRERQFGNKIQFFPKDLVFMSVSQILELINTLSPTGGLFENEKRVALGLRPLPELVGKRYMSLNWIDANNAQQYQVGKVDVVDEMKEDM